MPILDLYKICNAQFNKEKIISHLLELRTILNKLDDDLFYQKAVNTIITNFIHVLRDVNDEQDKEQIASYFPPSSSLNNKFYFQTQVSAIVYPLLVNCVLTSCSNNNALNSNIFGHLKIFFSNHLNNFLKELINSNRKLEDKLEDINTTGEFLTKCAKQLLDTSFFLRTQMAIELAVFFAETAKKFLDINLVMSNISSPLPSEVLGVDADLSFFILINGYIQLEKKEEVEKNVKEVFEVTSAILKKEEIEVVLMETSLVEAVDNLIAKHYYKEALTLLRQLENIFRGNIYPKNQLKEEDEEYCQRGLVITFANMAYCHMKLNNFFEAQNCLNEVSQQAHIIFAGGLEDDVVQMDIKKFMSIMKKIFKFTIKSINQDAFSNNEPPLLNSAAVLEVFAATVKDVTNIMNIEDDFMLEFNDSIRKYYDYGNSLKNKVNKHEYSSSNVRVPREETSLMHSFFNTTSEHITALQPLEKPIGDDAAYEFKGVSEEVPSGLRKAYEKSMQEGSQTFILQDSKEIIAAARDEASSSSIEETKATSASDLALKILKPLHIHYANFLAAKKNISSPSNPTKPFRSKL